MTTQMSKCKGCGKEIIWGTTIDGKKIPLDPRPPVYAYDADNEECVRLGHAPDGSGPMVSHFATCPKANDFSGSKREK